jgi:DNA-binding Lrp family transcriptional regulator
LEQTKHVGARAGALKYDLLTALNIAGLHGSPTEQTSLMRLMLLITARYNWRVEEVSVGHAELARLWAVNNRTVKREMKRLLEMGVITCIRPGVRGRVGAYRLNYRRIYALSQPCWSAIGPDFEDRMMEMSGARTVVKVDFNAAQTPHLKPVSDEIPAGSWGAVRRRLKAEHPTLFESWFAKLVQDTIEDHTLTLRAPNRFVSRYIETHFATKLARAVDAEMPTKDGAPRQIVLVSTQP